MKKRKLLAMLSAATLTVSASAGYFPMLNPTGSVLLASAAEDLPAPAAEELPEIPDAEMTEAAAETTEPVKQSVLTEEASPSSGANAAWTAGSQAQNTGAESDSLLHAAGRSTVSATVSEADDFAYTVSDGTVTISGYSGSDSAVTIPNAIDGKPVVKIGNNAFSDKKSIRSVSIPASVEEIGNYAFAGCAALQTVTLHEGLKTLGYHAFSNTAISQIYIPATLESANWSFEYCALLETVTFGSGITKIPNTLFAGSGLTAVTIPNTVTAIGSHAFRNCANLTAIDIPANVETLGEYAFGGCDGLKTVTLHEGLKTLGYRAFYNAPISKIYIPVTLESANCPFEYCASLNNITFSSGITKIPNNLFYNCSGLTAVTIPNTVTAIGSRAFDSCDYLTAIDIPANVETLGEYAFSGCDSLQTVTLHEGLKTLGYRAFYYAPITKIYIPATLESANCPFEICTLLETVTFGSGITKIPNTLFYNCAGLTAVTIPNTVTTIGNAAFQHCDNLTAIDIPANVENINEYAFEGDDGLQTVTLHEGLKTLGYRAFRYAPISKIYIPATLESANCPFEECASLNNITFGSGITKIRNTLFYNCAGLTAVTIPNTVTAIGNAAFQRCGNLTAIDIPANVETINEYAFDGDDGLQTVTLHEGLKTLGYRAFRYAPISKIYIPATLESVNWSFADCASLNNVTFGSGITKIPNTLFAGCNGLTAVTIPNTVTTIGNAAFQHCGNLTAIDIPANVENINEYAFDGNDGLQTVTLHEGLKTLGYRAFRYAPVSKIYIPATLESANWSFADCASLNNVTFGSGITKIPNTLFAGCNGLTAVTIPNTVTTIGNAAFQHCENLTAIDIPANVENINEYAFDGDDALQIVTLHEGLKTLGYRAFRYTPVTMIRIPTTLESVSSPFADCASLTDVRFTDGIEYIPNSLFAGCNGITNIDIPESVLTIGDRAFEYCAGLTAITVPDGVTSIRIYAFNGCTNLTIKGISGSYAETYAADNNIPFEAVSKVSITYKANGGTGSDVVQKHITGAKATLKDNTFTRSGYTFTGWNTKADGTGTSYPAGKIVAWESNVTLYAQWQSTQVTITYKANGGTGADVVQSHAPGAAATLKPASTFTRSGYTFTGWNSKADGTGNTYAAGKEVKWQSNVTLYAQWKKNEATITYKANGGTGADVVQSHTPGAAATLKPANTFTRSGYVFIGWNTKADGTGNTYAAGKEVKWQNNVTLYAQWAVQRTITYKANGGTGSDVVQKHGSGVKVNLLSNGFTRSGYTFAGWNSKADGSGNTYAAGAEVAWKENVTLYAQWKKNEATITYKANGGTGADVVQSHTPGAAATLKPANTFTRSGYVFIGWNSKADGTGNTYAAGKEVKWQNNVTLYAQWAVQRTITYKANGGIGSDIVQKHGSGVKVNLLGNGFTRSGYTFTGWNSKADGSGNTYAAGAEVAWKDNVTLYAQWKKNEATITYKANGGTGADVVQSHTPGAAATLKPANTFTRSGYVFIGWNSKADGTGNTYAAGKEVKWQNNVTLYAQWAVQRTITYKANGGTGSDVVQKHGSGVKVSLLGNGFTRSGYTFAGWNSKADGSGNTYAAGAEVAWKDNVTLYAQWKRNQATITYKANGGTGADVVQSHDAGGKATLKAAGTFTRSGYVFAGWNTKADGSGNTYAAGAQVTWSDNVTLYAQWRKAVATITYYANDGSGNDAEQEHVPGEKINLLGGIFIRSGYTFIGWNTKADGTGNAYAAGAEVAWQNNVTLYAQWKKN